MRSLFKAFLNPVVILSSLGLGLFLTAALLVTLWFSRPGETGRGASTAVVNIIRVPTSTATAKPAEEVEAPISTVPSATFEPGVIQTGGWVEVTGTEGAGLRVRENPGLSQGVLFLANEREIFQILAGPEEIDGYSWWQLISPDDETRAGWAVANYLRGVVPP